MTNREKLKELFPEIPDYSGIDYWGDFWDEEFDETMKVGGLCPSGFLSPVEEAQGE